MNSIKKIICFVALTWTVALVTISLLGWTAAQVITLTDTNWSLIKITNQTTNQTQLEVASCRTTLYLDSNGHYKGYSGCNGYNGNYSKNTNEKLTMDNPMRTKRGCKPPCGLGETLFDYFPKTNKYLIKADTLFLWTTDSVQITFQKK